MYLELERLSDDGIQTIGTLSVRDQKDNLLAVFDTIELTWKNNQRRVSCIPNGYYFVKKKFSFRFGNCFEVLNVTGRDGILLHSGNFHSDTLGCILIGKTLKYINDDILLDVCNSKISLKGLLALSPEMSFLRITTKFFSYELK